MSDGYTAPATPVQGLIQSLASQDSGTVLYATSGLQDRITADPEFFNAETAKLIIKPALYNFACDTHAAANKVLWFGLQTKPELLPVILDEAIDVLSREKAFDYVRLHAVEIIQTIITKDDKLFTQSRHAALHAARKYEGDDMVASSLDRLLLHYQFNAPARSASRTNHRDITGNPGSP